MSVNVVSLFCKPHLMRDAPINQHHRMQLVNNHKHENNRAKNESKIWGATAMTHQLQQFAKRVKTHLTLNRNNFLNTSHISGTKRLLNSNCNIKFDEIMRRFSCKVSLARVMYYTD